MFLAHTSSINKNSYKVLSQYNNNKVLVNSDGYRIVSNVCPHQKSIISRTDGTGNRVCPYHNWSFDIKGDPLTSGRTGHFCKNTVPLESTVAYEWNSLLFDIPVNFNIPIDFKNVILLEERLDIVNSDYRNIMDIFLDVDHVQSVHAGVYDLIDITNIDVKYDYYPQGAVQYIAQGAYWIAVYPFTMIEWQKGSIFITVASPFGDKSKVHVFKYVDVNHLKDWKLNEYVWETAWKQDRDQAEIITEFPRENLEEQKIHFRKFLEKNGLN